MFFAVFLFFGPTGPVRKFAVVDFLRRLPCFARPARGSINAVFPKKKLSPKNILREKEGPAEGGFFFLRKKPITKPQTTTKKQETNIKNNTKNNLKTIENIQQFKRDIKS